MKCEKQQAAALAQYLRRLLNDLPPPADRPLDGTLEMTPAGRSRRSSLGPIGLAYDRDRDRFLVQLEELVVRDDEDDDDDDEAPERDRTTRAAPVPVARPGVGIRRARRGGRRRRPPHLHVVQPARSTRTATRARG